MTTETSPANSGSPSRRWWTATVALVLVAAGCLALGVRSHRYALPGPVASTPAPLPASPATTPPTTPQSEPSRLAVVRSVPVLLNIPAIGVSVSLSSLGLNPDGTVEVPTDFQQPGWYRLGPSPGQVGSAVILGHVDSYRGPAVFFRLRSLRAGDPVEVTLADGVVAQFAVTAVAAYPKAQFPAQRVYGSQGYSALQLVTCGGQFDSATGHYLSNIVAYTTLVATTPAPGVGQTGIGK
jgi:hypothetical protein